MTGPLTADEIFGAGRAPTRGVLPLPHAAPTLAMTLHDVRVYIRRYVVVTDDQAVAIALWCAHTHAIEAADCTPYLQITSATKRSGKTRLLEALEPLVARPWLTGRVSAAALVRKVDADRPTLLLDESDAALGAAANRDYSEALRGLLNSGYRRSGRSTICIGQGASLTTRDFVTFSAKAIAGIGELPGTVADRSIKIELRRRTNDEPCARWRARDGGAEATPLHEQFVAWANNEAMVERLRAARPPLPTGLGDRQSDVWEPLFAIADVAGGDWPEQARTAALRLAGTDEDTDTVVELLRDIAEVLTGHSADAVASATLLKALVVREDRPWADWRHGRPLSARGLARLLAPLGVIADRCDTPEGRLRGYRLAGLDDAIARYLPTYVSIRPSANETGPELPISTRPAGSVPNTSKTPETPTSARLWTHGHIGRGGEGRLPLDGGRERTRV